MHSIQWQCAVPVAPHKQNHVRRFPACTLTCCPGVGSAAEPGGPSGERWLAVTGPAACGLAGWGGSPGAERAAGGGEGWSGRMLVGRHWAQAAWPNGAGRVWEPPLRSSGGPREGRSWGPGTGRRAGAGRCTGGCWGTSCVMTAD